MAAEAEKVTVLDVLEDFWAECEQNEKPFGTMRSHLASLGYDPDALSRRLELMVAEARANREHAEKLKEEAAKQGPKP
jgi:hypothetical protein